MRWHFWTAALLLSGWIFLVGCNTVEGMRRDLEEATVAVEAWQQQTADAIDEAFYSDD